MTLSTLAGRGAKHVSGYLRKMVSSDRRTAAILLALGFLVFVSSPVRTVFDSHFTIAYSQVLIEDQNCDLADLLGPKNPDGTRRIDVPFPYQMTRVGNRIYYFFPPGSSFLSLPFVLLFKAAGVSARTEGGTYHYPGEELMQGIMAALVSALTLVFFFLTARFFIARRWSVLVAVGIGVASPIWSSTSRALWADTWGMLLVSIAIWLAVRNEVTKARLRPVLLGCLLAWAFFCKSVFALPALAISVHVLTRSRRDFLVLASVGAAWFVLLVVHSLDHYGKWLPPHYMQSTFTSDVGAILKNAAGVVVSPSRGILVFMPVMLVIFFLLVRHWRLVPVHRFVWIAVACLVGQVFVVAAYHKWWGGHSFGPRLMAPIVPWFALLAAIGFKGFLERQTTEVPRRRFERWAVAGTAAVCVVFGLAVHGSAATSHWPWVWNTVPRNVDVEPEKALWDWSYPQFASAFVSLPMSLEAYTPYTRGTRVAALSPAGSKFFNWVGGWGQHEPPFIWNERWWARFTFSLETPQGGTHGAGTLRLRIRPFLAPPKVDRQRVNVLLNGREIGSFSLTNADAEVKSFQFGEGTLGSKNVVWFEIPDATSPKSIRRGNDQRMPAIAVEWFEIE